MISLATLADLARRFESEISLPVEPLWVGDRRFDVNTAPAIMGCVNLSRDSSYRDSIAASTESAVRRGRVLAAQGADFVDIGAQSSGPGKRRVAAERQTELLVPVVKELASCGIQVSVETYEPDVARSCLEAGAQIVNYTGGAGTDPSMFAVIAKHQATLVMCFIEGENARDTARSLVYDDPIPRMKDYFEARLDSARSFGVDRVIVDPGITFTRSDSVGVDDRLRDQAVTLLNAFRLRRLGVPILQSLPAAYELFEDQYRTAESFFAVLAHLGGAGVYRTHEVPKVKAILGALRYFSP